MANPALVLTSGFRHGEEYRWVIGLGKQLSWAMCLVCVDSPLPQGFFQKLTGPVSFTSFLFPKIEPGTFSLRWRQSGTNGVLHVERWSQLNWTGVKMPSVEGRGERRAVPYGEGRSGVVTGARDFGAKPPKRSTGTSLCLFWLPHVYPPALKVQVAVSGDIFSCHDGAGLGCCRHPVGHPVVTRDATTRPATKNHQPRCSQCCLWNGWWSLVPEYRRNNVSRAGLGGAWNSPKSIEDNSLRDLGYSHAVFVARASVSFASAVSSMCPNLHSDFVFLKAAQPCVPGSQETPDSIWG